MKHFLGNAEEKEVLELRKRHKGRHFKNTEYCNHRNQLMYVVDQLNIVVSNMKAIQPLRKAESILTWFLLRERATCRRVTFTRACGMFIFLPGLVVAWSLASRVIGWTTDTDTESRAQYSHYYTQSQPTIMHGIQWVSVTPGNVSLQDLLQEEGNGS